ncbi:MAG: ion transport 2 domain protein [Bacteroidetes bacterium 4572_112]|nr:MAG: ion transport 2 domain protein [Bacteroidetes bacterium 4572_112]
MLDLLLVIVESNNPDSAVHSFSDAFWYMIVTITSVGYGDIVPVSFIGKGIGYIFIFSSLIVLGILISSMSTNISTMIEENKLGYRGTKFENHIVCIGWNDFSHMVVNEVLHASRKVAIVTNRKDDVELIYNLYDKKSIFVLYADYDNLESISKTNPDMASEVFLGFEEDTAALLYVINFKKRYPKPNIVVAIKNHKLHDTFLTAGVKYVVARNEIASKLVASYVFEPDVAKLNIDLLGAAVHDEDFDNQQYLVTEKNPFLNKNYDDAFVKLKLKYNIVLLGISKHDNNGGHAELLVNARSETVIELGDYLIVMVSGKKKKRVEKLFGISEGKF